MVKINIFKKRTIEEIKQPQEYYCSNISCTNEVARFSPLVDCLTRNAYTEYAYYYCIDCITERRYK